MKKVVIQISEKSMPSRGKSQCKSSTESCLECEAARGLTKKEGLEEKRNRK